MLVARIGTAVGAIPVAHVVETMRPLPIEPLPHAPPFVAGVAIVRGEPVPVIDGARLLGVPADAPGRFVVVRAGERRAALAVDSVLDVRRVTAQELGELPALGGVASRDVIESIGVLDVGLMYVLQASRLVERASP